VTLTVVHPASYFCTIRNLKSQGDHGRERGLKRTTVTDMMLDQGKKQPFGTHEAMKQRKMGNNHHKRK
jgi:hypothetical protein